MEGLAELIEVKQEPGNIADGFTYVGRIAGITMYFRQFSVLKQTATGKYFLNVLTSIMIPIEPKYYIEFNNVDKLREIIERYDQQKQAVGVFQGAGFAQVIEQRLVPRTFNVPLVVEDDKQGWHCISDRMYGPCSINGVATVENDCVMFCGTHNAFIIQMTASDARLPTTVVETAHSHGFVAFIHRDDSMLFTLFYFQGKTKQDIPVDMQACIDRYGRVINDDDI